MGIENKVKDIEEKLKDSDVSQKDVEDINKLSTDKKGAEALRNFLNTPENQDLIKKLICDAFDKCSLDKHTGDIWLKFKNSIENVNKDKTFDGLIDDLQAKIDVFQSTIDQNDIKIAQENTAKTEKLNKEKSQDELSTYLNIMPSKEDDINKMADGLFETNEARFNALFDKDFRDALTPSQQANLTKYIQTYLPDAKDITFDKINFVKTTKDKVLDGDKTQRQSDKYPVGTNMIRIDGNTKTEIVFGTQDQAQTRISEAYIEANPSSINELGNQIANGENNEYIVNELNEKGSYITLAKIIEKKPEVISKLLSNGFIESLMKSGNKLEEANKKISAENNKPGNKGKEKPLLNETSLKSILDQQRDGYLNVINNAVLNIMKQPNITVSSPERGMFQTYMQSCNKDPRALGATVDQRIASWNNVATRYKGFQEKNQLFFTDVISSSLPDIANRPNNTELALHKAINNDFNALWIHIKGEGNEKYGLKAQMKSLFESFKDEILMIAEFLGFDKEKIMHRCGFNKELKDEMTKFFKEKYGLTGDQLNDIDKLSIGNPTLLENIKTVATNGSTKPGEVTPFKDNKDAITAFRNSKDIRKTYLESLKTVTPSGDFIKTLISQYNATQKNENDHIQYLDYVTKVNKNGKDAFEPTKGKREDLINNHGEKLRNLDFVWDNIAGASANLAAMASPDRTGKGSESKTPEMAGMVLDQIKKEKGSNTNEDMLVGVSYYLSSMVIGGHDKLEYTISENNDKQPTATQTPETTKKPETIESLSKTLSINADYIDTAKTTDTKITLDKDVNPIKINAIFTNFSEAPAGLKIDEQDYIKKGDTYVDAKNTPVKIKEGTTIESMEADKLADLIVSNTIEEVTKSSKTTKAPQDNYDKTTNKDYGDKVIKPIFDLFSAENTYKSLVKNTTINQTIKDPNTLKFMLQYSTKDKSATGSAEENHNKAVTDIIAQIKSDSKVSFEQNVDKTAIVAVIKDKEDKVTAKREIGQGFTLKNTSEQVKSPEKTPATIDYTSINTLRTSLGYIEIGKIPPNYTKKLMTELLKVETTENQQDMIVKEIVRTKLAEGNKIQDISTSQKGTKILDTIVYEPGTGEFNTTCDIIKTGDKDIEINIENGKGKKFTIKTTIDDITKPIA